MQSNKIDGTQQCFSLSSRHHCRWMCRQRWYQDHRLFLWWRVGSFNLMSCVHPENDTFSSSMELCGIGGYRWKCVNICTDTLCICIYIYIWNTHTSNTLLANPSITRFQQVFSLESFSPEARIYTQQWQVQSWYNILLMAEIRPPRWYFCKFLPLFTGF